MKILQTKQLYQTPEAPSPKEPVVTTVQEPDLEKEVMESPLDEESGLNNEVADTAKIVEFAFQKGVAAKIGEIVRSTQSGSPVLFAYPELNGTPIGNIKLKLFMTPDPKTNMLSVKGAAYERNGVYEEINVFFGFSPGFVQIPANMQIKALRRASYSEEVGNAIVHELTHAFEEGKRRGNGAGSIQDSQVDHIAKQLMSDPLVTNIGRRLYLIDDPEMNARVAEVGAVMRNADPEAEKEQLIDTIRNTRVWKEIAFIRDFPANDVYQALYDRAQAAFPGEDSEQKILAALQKGVLASNLPGYNGGKSDTSMTLKRILAFRSNTNKSGVGEMKDLKTILGGLEKLFAQKAEDLKRRVLKTISLARPRPTPGMAPAQEPAQQDSLALAEEEEVLDEMAYPASFDHATFRELRNFTQRINYCREHLGKPLGNGSSRIVFAVDDEKVIKIAKNAKGIAQNESESQYDFQNFYSDVVAVVYDSHPQDLWIEMEKAVKITSESKFKQLFNGISLKDMNAYLTNKFMKGYKVPLDPRTQALMDEDDAFFQIVSMVGERDMMINDLTKLNSWGMVRRKGVEMPVLVDFGISNGDFDTHYRQPASASRYRHAGYSD